MHGGGNGQFAAVPLNLLPLSDEKAFGDYIVSGTWSQSAHKEALRFSPAKVAADCAEGGKFKRILEASSWKLNPDASYVYFCDNETVNGVEFPSVPDVGDKLLVGDMSSNFLTRPIDVSKFGIVWAGAQKNCGIPGVTIVIVRKDLLQIKGKARPNVLDYAVVSEGKSVYNTPDTFAVYVAGLMFKWIEKKGGVEAMRELTAKKAGLLYEYLDTAPDFYATIVDKAYRSRMNVVFRVVPNSLEAEFVKESQARGLHGLAGHRSVGGIRASLYNAVTAENVQALVAFMEEFRAKHKQ
jgi:phosphoserine aminotransferase